MSAVLKVFKLPDLGEGLTESEIVSWHVAVGESVQLNQVIAEVETAKAVVEIPSPYSGTVTQLHADPGAVVEVGHPIVSFEVPDDAGPGAFDGGPDGQDRAGAPAPGGGTTADPAGDALPAAGREAERRQPTLVGYGAEVERTGRPARRLRTAGVAAAAPGVGRPVPGGAAPAGDPTGAAPAGAPAGEGRAGNGERNAPAERPRSTPPVRKLARDLGIELELVPGTGEHGLITRSDVELAAGADRPSTATTTSPAGSGGPDQPGPSRRAAGGATVPRATRTLGGRPREERTPIHGVRRLTAEAMVASAFTAPHATEFLTVDVSPTMELLERLSGRPGFAGVKLTPLTIVAKAVCLALERTPSLNARWDADAGEIVQFNFVNLGIAAATPRGLMVPNIKEAQALDLGGLARALGDLARTAREGKTPPADLVGGTISITNVGVFGVDAGTPILNPGEAAILAIGQVRRMPWEHRDEIALRQVLTLSLSFDHRVVDGEQGSRFLADVGTILADPGMLIAMV